jgi:pimeloyl-ACP methyl ester carboxylesterase
MSFANIGGVQLFFVDEGQGEPMLFVHGYTCDSHDWSWQVPHFVADRRVIVADLRGHGRSSVPSGGYEPLQFAADLAGLLHHLECGPVIAVGHSLGGLVASALAVEHPQDVRAVVAVDPAYLISDEISEAMGPLLEALSTVDPVPLVQSLLDGGHGEATPSHLRCWHLGRTAGVPAHVLRDTILNMSRGPQALTPLRASEPFLRRRTCPVFSFYTDPARAALEERLFIDPRSKAVSWEGSGHWLHQERPAEFNSLVDRWLASL